MFSWYFHRTIITFVVVFIKILFMHCSDNCVKLLPVRFLNLLYEIWIYFLNLKYILLEVCEGCYILSYCMPFIQNAAACTSVLLDFWTISFGMRVTSNALKKYTLRNTNGSWLWIHKIKVVNSIRLQKFLEMLLKVIILKLIDLTFFHALSILSTFFVFNDLMTTLGFFQSMNLNLTILLDYLKKYCYIVPLIFGHISAATHPLKQTHLC